MFTKEEINCAFFGFLCYDEKNIEKHVQDFFPGWKFHFKGWRKNSHFSGVIVSPDGKTVYIAERGTDGDGFTGKLKSWMTNIDTDHDLNGVHDGFERTGGETFDLHKDFLPYVQEVWICGHSQGGGSAQRTAQLCCRHLSNEKQIHLVLFGSPPAFTSDGVWEMRGYMKEKAVGTDKPRLAVRNIMMPGDPMATDLFRKDGPPLDGRDIVPIEYLPDLIDYRIGPADWVNHSPKMYCAGMLTYLALDHCPDLEKFWMIGNIFKRCVN